MAKLSVSELKKRPQRIEIFANKIKEKSPFELNNKKKVILTDKNLEFLTLDEISKFGGNSKAILKFEDIDGNKYRLTDFLKSKEFGGGNGSGAGAEVTALAECAFCIVSAYIIKYGKFDFDSSLKENLNNINVDLGKTNINDVIKFLKENPDWLKSTEDSAFLFVKTANLNTLHAFHRDSKYFNEIYNEFSRLLKPINKDKLRIGTDKWNPGDVWVSNKSSLPSFNSIDDYNEYLNKEFNNNNIMAVSLKKTGLTPKIIPVTISKNTPVQFDNLTPVTMKSKDMYINTKDGTRIQIRSFNSGANVQAEIKGDYANHGKIGFGNIQYFLKLYDNIIIPTNQEISKMSIDDVVDYVNKKFKTKFSTDDIKSKDINDFKISKYQSVFIADVIEKSHSRDKILSAIINYAKSQGGIEGLFEPSIYYKIF